MGSSTCTRVFSVGYYIFLRQQVIWCPSVRDDNTKSRVDIKNM